MSCRHIGFPPLNLSVSHCQLLCCFSWARDSTQVTEDGEAVNGVLVMFGALAVCALATLAVGYQVTIIQPREWNSDEELA